MEITEKRFFFLIDVLKVISKNKTPILNVDLAEKLSISSTSPFFQLIRKLLVENEVSTEEYEYHGKQRYVKIYINVKALINLLRETKFHQKEIDFIKIYKPLSYSV